MTNFSLYLFCLVQVFFSYYYFFFCVFFSLSSSNNFLLVKRGPANRQSHLVRQSVVRPTVRRFRSCADSNAQLDGDLFLQFKIFDLWYHIELASTYF